MKRATDGGVIHIRHQWHVISTSFIAEVANALVSSNNAISVTYNRGDLVQKLFTLVKLPSLLLKNMKKKIMFFYTLWTTFCSQVLTLCMCHFWSCASFFYIVTSFIHTAGWRAFGSPPTQIKRHISSQYILLMRGFLHIHMMSVINR